MISQRQYIIMYITTVFHFCVYLLDFVIRLDLLSDEYKEGSKVYASSFTSNVNYIRCCSKNVLTRYLSKPSSSVSVNEFHFRFRFIPFLVRCEYSNCLVPVGSNLIS